MMSRELKVGIIGGLISSILVIIFIQPILSWVWGAVLSFGEAVQAGYVDRIYRKAALGPSDEAGNLTLVVLINMFLYVLLAERLPQAVQSVFRVAIVIMSMVTLIPIALWSGVSDINASFNQRLAVMAPAVSDQEHKQWRAQWAKMRGRNDYRALVADMDRRATDLQIKLPELREP